MCWHSSNVLPAVGETIIFQYKEKKSNSFFEMNMREGDDISHIEKWCYKEDYRNASLKTINNLTKRN